MKRGLRVVMMGAVTGVAAVGGGALFAAPAHAQSAVQPPPQTEVAPRAQIEAPNLAIRRIVVQGNQRIESSTVTSYLLVRPGDMFDPARVDLSLKTLFATGLFADVQIVQQGADLVVRVVENPIVNRVIFEGARNIKEETLEKEIQAKPRSVFTPARAQADVQKIIEQYRRSGRFAASVTPQVKELEQNRVDLIFEIDEGPVTGVQSINFIGNSAFSDNDLRKVLLTQESRWWRLLSKNDNYDPDRLEYDRELLRQYYTNRGYADFRVISATAELTPDQKDFFITVTVDEGLKYDFGEVKVQTELDRVPAELLRAVVPIREGAVFEGELIEKSIDAMTFTAGTGGYANVDIRPRIERNPETRKVDVTFEVNEGARVFVERIDIVGNTRTVDNVIRRELRVTEGDAFNRILLDRSRSRIRSLGFFKNVEVTEREGAEPDRAVIEVAVEEEATGELSFAAGFSSYDNFLFDVSISERNLRGRGQFLRLRASTSSRRNQLDLRFTEPRFLGRDLAAGFDIYTLQSDYYGYENKSTGVALRAAFPITDSTNMALTYTLRSDEVSYDECAFNTGSAQCLENSFEGSYATSVVSYTFNWDKKNDPITPTRGFDFQLRQDLAGVGADVSYLRTEASSTLYRGLFPGVTASFALSGGYITGWNGDIVRLNDRFFKGGSSFRGFDVAGIGPRVTETRQSIANPEQVDVQYYNSSGGLGYYIGTLEVTVPTGLPEEYGLSGALFTEFGGVGLLDDEVKADSSAEFCLNDLSAEVACDGGAATTFVRRSVDDALSLRASYGVSIFWDSPFGPVQFDFAQPFIREDFDRTETFRFSQRTRF
jgi:outer membrane protein insertion porin family